MKKIGLGILVAGVAAVLVVSVAYALPTNRGIDRAKGRSPVIDEDTREVVAPPTVPVFPQLPESELTKIVFIRYAPGFQKEKFCNDNEVCEPELGEKWQFCSDCPKPGGEEEEPTTACYDFLAGSKPRWNWIEGYYYSISELGTASTWATGVWKGATSATIFGDGVSGTYPWGEYNYYNSISYGDYDDTGLCPSAEPCVIAVTAIWFRGKNIYEYDIMFDTNFFPNLGEPDLDTVALHEFGHGAGLNDLYDSVCSGNVMYGYYEGEKTSLADGDIAGIQRLYGK